MTGKFYRHRKGSNRRRNSFVPAKEKVVLIPVADRDITGAQHPKLLDFLEDALDQGSSEKSKKNHVGNGDIGPVLEAGSKLKLLDEIYAKENH